MSHKRKKLTTGSILTALIALLCISQGSAQAYTICEGQNKAVHRFDVPAPEIGAEVEFPQLLI
ncbi:MAG: hypothetical protein AAGC55_19900, partial [Myxococcota bacterium]